MSKITPDHLARHAYVYVRQSRPDQLLHNHESRRRQYGLADRARQLGWSEVVVIDDDLGRSGGGIARPGFERLLGAICEGRVGIVLAIEASRLARNGRDWHMLLEFCGLVGCLLADEDGVYDAKLPNDRLLLGMKGTMSEMELSILRQRSLEALRQKARRGELFFTVAVGYIKTRHDRIAMDPDLRVREALALVFRKFAEFQSIRQVHLWLRQERIRLPAIERTTEGPRVVCTVRTQSTGSASPSPLSSIGRASPGRGGAAAGSRRAWLLIGALLQEGARCPESHARQHSAGPCGRFLSAPEVGQSASTSPTAACLIPFP